MVSSKVQTKKPFNTDPLERDQGNASRGLLDSLLGHETQPQPQKPVSEQFHPGPINREIFSFSNHHENKLIPQEIMKLKEAINIEVNRLKAVNNSVADQITNIQRETLSSMPEKAGIYQVRFLETLLSMVRLLRARVSEAGTWLTAINTKKAKRGSLYKKQTKAGTKNSVAHMLSQEKSSARPTQ
jgi:hypothetical protein